MEAKDQTAIINALRQQVTELERIKGVSLQSQKGAIGALHQNDKKGAFKRKDAVFQDRITKDGPYQPESGRYVLYVSYACPWASRCLALLHLKNLDDHIEICSVYPTWGKTRPNNITDVHKGWIFAPEGDFTMTNPAGWGEFGPIANLTQDTVLGKKTIREVYESQVGRDTHTFSVPVLFDKKTKQIVCNESSLIIRDFNSMFNELPGVNADLDFAPSDLEVEMEKVDNFVYPGLNNGVYKCGFAKGQEAYEEAFYGLYDTLDKMEDILSKQRYLCGDRITLSDIRAFVTLIRFDEVYAVYFKCNGKLIREYPNILNYTRELYQIPGIKKSVDMTHIKNHYYTSHPQLNTYGIVPLGPRGLKENRDDPEGHYAIFVQPHDRNKFTLTGKITKFLPIVGVVLAVAGIGSLMLKKKSA